MSDLMAVKTCELCHRTFECGGERSEWPSCWCDAVTPDVPPLEGPGAPKDCICPTCLPKWTPPIVVVGDTEGVEA